MQRLLAETGGDVSQAEQLESNTFGSAKDSRKLWPGVVPYTISKDLGTFNIMVEFALCFIKYNKSICFVPLFYP